MDKNTPPPPRHPFGLRYILLLIGAWIIRIPSFVGMRRSKESIAEVLKQSKVTRTRINVPSREKGRSIKVDVYEKIDEKSGRERRGKKFVHVNFHGSGFVIPSLGMDLEFCALLAAKTSTTVLDCDYCKAPEHPFPAAYQDAQDILTYITTHSSDFDTEHITVSGFSAGANIAMAAAVNSPKNLIKGLVSIYGNPDMTKSYPAPSDIYDSGMILPDWMRAFFYRCLVLPSQGRDDTRLSPAYAEIGRWPERCLFACGTADSLHGPGEEMVRKLKAGRGQGVDVEFLSVKREAHAFDKGIKAEKVDTAQRTVEVYKRAIELVERAHW